jgi:Mrp family chromosome partitioning ATPase/capsular polysaccharide biosynthesis protein
MNETTDATAIFAPIWRRKWLILAVGVIVAAGSYFYYKRQRPTYRASTQIFLGASAEEQAPGEKIVKSHSTLSDQAAVINTIVVEQVRRRLRSEGNGKLVARNTKVKAKAPEKSEFITITAEGHPAREVVLLANLTAQAYIRRRQESRQRAVEKAIAINRRQLKRIEQSALAKIEKPANSKKKAGSTSSSTTGSAGSSSGGQSASSVIQETNISSTINKLEASLGTVSAQQVRPARPGNATLLSPKPRKDAIFGFVIGLVLAAIAAYAFSRFDRRLRTIPAIEAAAEAPLLAAVPRVRRPIVRAAGQSPRPSKQLLEPLRRLQAGLELSDQASIAAPSSHPRIILFVSPDPGDGKSTVVADLALVQRDAGARVIIVEANFRRPSQARLLGIEGDGRLGAVLSGRLGMEEAAQRVAPGLGPQLAAESQHGGAAVAQAEAGSLFLLGGDRSVPNPPALLGGAVTAELLTSLGQRFDYVLVDAPSPLEVSDVIPLFSLVDRIVVVARVGNSREISAQRLRQLLAAPSCAPVAGVVANFVAPAELKRYGFSTVGAGAWRGGRLAAR